MAEAQVFRARGLIEDSEQFKKLQPPAVLGVFGNPIEHSLSPVFQNAALAASGINGQYIRILAGEEEFVEAMRRLPKAGFLGANVTIPFKEAALKACDEADERAQLCRAVNTIVVDGGKLCGFNTDGPGFVRALREEFYVDLRDLRVMILGAGGGAGRALAVQCALERCERLCLVNRSLDKARQLARELASRFATDRLMGPTERCVFAPWDEEILAQELNATDLVVNATPLGLRRTDPSPLPPQLLTPNLLVYDTVYSRGRTPLIECAEAAGARAANGLSMLLHQGALAFEIWFGKEAPLETMRSALAGAVRA